MTLNLQYFASYPKGADGELKARNRLREVTSGQYAPDVICVQEGLASRDVLSPVGFDKVICAGEEGYAQSVYDMVYGDGPTLKMCDPSCHQQLLCNQIYMRKESPWWVLDKG